MDIESQISALEKLAQIDEQLTAAQGELSEASGALGDKHAQLELLEGKIQAATSAVDGMERTRSELSGEARQTAIQLDRSRERFSRCRTEREVNAAQREVEELRKLLRDREVEVQKLTGLADQARADITVLQEQRLALSSELDAEGGDAIKRLKQLRSSIEDFTAQRAVVGKELPPQLFRKYEQILKNRGSALAHSSDGTCSRCFIALAPMEFQRLRRRKELSACPSCIRILYYRPKPPPEEEGEGESAEGEPKA